MLASAALLALLAAAGPDPQTAAEPRAPPGLVDGEPRDWNAPPPGTAAEDAALWHSLRDATADAMVQMARVAQCSYRVRYGKYYEALGAAGQAGGEAAARSAAVRRALEKAATDAGEAAPATGLRVRACRYTHLYLDQALAEPALAERLTKLRDDSRSCAVDVGGFAARLAPRADAFEAALREVDAFLGRAPPAVPPAPDAAAAPAGKASP